jgi:hypothetical protein
MFIIFVIGDKSDILPSFINLTEILSTPVAFLNCQIFWIIFLTIFYVRLEKDMAVKLLF